MHATKRRKLMSVESNRPAQRRVRRRIRTGPDRDSAACRGPGRGDAGLERRGPVVGDRPQHWSAAERSAGQTTGTWEHPASDNRRRSVPALPDDDGIRGVDDGLLGVRPQSAACAGSPQIMRELFSPTDGIGLSMLRQPMGASDFAVDKAYSYDDQPAGRTDPGAVRLLHRARPGVHPAAVARGVRAESEAELHGDPVERAGLDEGQRLDDHRIAAADGRGGVRRTTS